MIRENKGKGNPVVTEGGGVPDGPKKKYQVRNGGVFGSTIKVIHDGFSFIFPFPPPFFHQEGSQPVSQVAQVGFCFLRDQFRND